MGSFVGRLADLANHLEPRGHERVANSGRKFDVADRRVVRVAPALDRAYSVRSFPFSPSGRSTPVQPRRVWLIMRGGFLLQIIFSRLSVVFDKSDHYQDGSGYPSANADIALWGLLIEPHFFIPTPSLSRANMPSSAIGIRRG